MVFFFLFKYYWGCGGYLGAAVLMSVRLLIFLTSTETLYKLFPLGSVSRAVYQAFFLSIGFGFLILGFWLLAEGARQSQAWNGYSYYCSMIGIWCTAKWGFFLTIPIYELRPDITDDRYLEKISSEMRSESRENSNFRHLVSQPL